MCEYHLVAPDLRVFHKKIKLIGQGIAIDLFIHIASVWTSSLLAYMCRRDTVQVVELNYNAKLNKYVKK